VFDGGLGSRDSLANCGELWRIVAD
jgi:hypothetical protein